MGVTGSPVFWIFGFLGHKFTVRGSAGLRFSLSFMYFVFLQGLQTTCSGSDDCVYGCKQLIDFRLIVD